MFLYSAGQIYLALVILSIPHLGLVLVRNNYKDTLYKVLNIPSKTSSTGSSLLDCYSIGTRLLVRKGLLYAPDHIIGTIPYTLRLLAPVVTHNYGYFPWLTWLSLSSLYKAIIGRFYNLKTSGMPSFNAANFGSDLYAGDTSILDKDGDSGILVGLEQVVLILGTTALIRLTGADNKVSITGLLLLLNSFTSQRSVSPNITKNLIAANINLGLGHNAEHPSIITLDQAFDIDTLLLPLFRNQQFTGAVAKGLKNTVIIPSLNTNTYTNNYNFIPVYKQSIDYCGSCEQQSAAFLRNVKTPSIVSIIQDTTKKGWDLLDTLILELLPQVDLMDSVNIALYLQAYYNNLLNLMLQLYLLDYKLVYRLLSVSLSTKSVKDTLSYLSTTNTEFNLKLQHLKDLKRTPIKGVYGSDDQRDYVDALSFINQLEDGSIIIKDGWGSLIRMHGGNIYISSALDTFIRPGRDFISMVPRLTLLQSNGFITISSKDNIRLGALHNICISSGIAGDLGVTTILNKTDKTKAAPLGISSGVIVKSLHDVVIKSLSDIYTLANKTTFNSKLSTWLLSLITNILAKTKTTLFGGTSRMDLTGGGLTTIAPSVVIDSTLTLMPVLQYDIIAGVLSLIYRGIPGGSNDIYTLGKLCCQSDIISNRLFFTDLICGPSYMSFYSIILEIRPTTAKAVASIKKVYNALNQLDTPVAFGDTLTQDLYTKKLYTNYNLFKFPAYNTFILCAYLPGMCWQNMLNTSGVFLPILAKSSDGETTVAYPGIPFLKLKISYWDTQSNNILLANCKTGYKVHRTKYKE